MPDVRNRETAEEIDSVAADWVARLDRGDLSSAENEALDIWLEGDPRRAGAFAKARAVSMLSERARALGPGYDPRTFETPRKPPVQMSRRQLLWGGSAAAASVAAASVAGYAVLGQGQAYATDRGQMKVVALSDGSVVSLNTASRIRVHYTSNRRTVHLDEGEALFDVAKDAVRPFLVLAGTTRVAGDGGSFAVRHLTNAPVEVIVRLGSVEVAPQAAFASSLHVDANMRVAAPQDSGVVRAPTAVAPIEIERATAWREGRIAFQGDSLAKAAREFERYSDTRIVIDDPAIAREEITGLFQVNDPVGFAHAVASSFDLQVAVSEKQVRLYR